MSDATRRQVLGGALAAGAIAACRRRGPRGAAFAGPIRALAFDAFPVFDPRPVAARLGALAGDRAPELLALWRARQFEYTWLLASAGRFDDFWSVTAAALRYAVRALDVPMSSADQRAVMQTFLELPAWPDAPAALAGLRDAGVRLAFLSNFTAAMLRSCIDRAGLTGLFERALSTEAARTFKPAPAAYRLGPRALGLAVDEIGFVAFAPWDAAGARWFGFPTFWVNRAGAAAEELGDAPAELADLTALAAAVTG